MGRIYKNGINYSGGIVPSSDAGVYINNLYLSNVNSDVATYKTLSYKIDAVETEMSLTLNASQGEQLGGVYLYPAGIGVTNIDAGVWSSDFTAKVSSTAGGSTSARVECFLRHTNGTETVLFTKTSEPITATEYTVITTQSVRQVFTTDISDRIGFKIYATTTRPQDTTISYIVGDGRGSHFSIPLPLRHSQLRAKDEETAYQHITSAQKTEMLNPTFTEASTLANVNSGESVGTLWGKVKKLFSFIGTTTLTTTAQTITTAINELVGINAYATGSPTYVANVTALSMAINKAGKQKNCSLALSLNQNLSANDIIFVLPIGFRPTFGEITVCCVAGNASYQCLYLDIGVNGYVSCPVALTAGTQIFAKLTFV